MVKRTRSGDRRRPEKGAGGDRRAGTIGGMASPAQRGAPAVPKQRSVVRAGAEEKPPGLDRVRRLLRHPAVRGTWLWIRQIGRWLRAGWRWLSANAGPLLASVARAAATGAEIARRASAAGRIARQTGSRMGNWSRRRRASGARGRFDDALSDAQAGLSKWGGTVEREAADASGVLDSVGELARTLSGGDAGRGGARSAKRASAAAANPLPEPVDSEPVAPLPEPEDSEPADPLPPIGPDLADLGAPPSKGAAAEPDPMENVRARIRKLGRRRRTGPLRQLIRDLVAIHGWTTADELAGWLGMGKKYLRRRHLNPMLDAGRLRLRHPDDATHPEQAYALPRRSSGASGASGRTDSKLGK